MIDQQEFATAALASDKEAFVLHVAYLRAEMLIQLARKALKALLLIKEVGDPKEYADFSYVFSKKLADVLFKRLYINEDAINLKPGKQPPYGPIYSLGPLKLKTLKTYIKTNLANRFI